MVFLVFGKETKLDLKLGLKQLEKECELENSGLFAGLSVELSSHCKGIYRGRRAHGQDSIMESADPPMAGPSNFNQCGVMWTGNLAERLKILDHNGVGRHQYLACTYFNQCVMKCLG